LKKYTLIFFSALCFLGLQTVAQENTIKIDATLDTKTNTVNIQQEINYINTSNDTLKFIYLHNWPNSFRNRKTTLSKDC